MKKLAMFLAVAGLILAASGAAQAVTLTQTSTRLYSYGNSQQTNGTADTDSDQLLAGAGGTEAVADAIRPAADGLALDGISSFAIASSTIDGAGYHQLDVVNQATGDPGGAVEGWGYSVAYALVTYATAAGAGESIGDPMTVTLDVLLGDDTHATGGDDPLLYEGDTNDEAFLDVGYALGTGLTYINPVEGNPAADPNPNAAQFGGYTFWSDTLTPSFSDSLTYNGVIGDDVQVLLAMSSYSYSNWGYAWTNAGFEGTVTAVPEPGTMILLVLGGGLALLRRKRSYGA